MISNANRNSQGGIALVVSLIFLLTITIISVVAAGNSRYALQISSNAQDSLRSFQSAEAGVYAALATSGTAGDLFVGRTTRDVFGAMADADSPLGLLETGASSVTTDVLFTTDATVCPRKLAGSSVGLFDCEYYRIESAHAVAQRARTQVNMGVVKTIISKGAL